VLNRTTRLAVALALVAGFVSLIAQGPPTAARQAAQTIHQAPQAGDAATVNMLLDATPTLINTKDENGRTALRIARTKGLSAGPSHSRGARRRPPLLAPPGPCPVESTEDPLLRPT